MLIKSINSCLCPRNTVIRRCTDNHSHLRSQLYDCLSPARQAGGTPARWICHRASQARRLNGRSHAPTSAVPPTAPRGAGRRLRPPAARHRRGEPRFRLRLRGRCASGSARGRRRLVQRDHRPGARCLDRCRHRSDHHLMSGLSTLAGSRPAAHAGTSAIARRRT
ncbi:hypothetical protein F3J11_08540, partial [Burkholderia sp. Cy-647]|nr:hypothetical protein [Burkholderia sp. Cy-647]